MSLPQTYFDRLYAGDPDPWRFATRAYEARKRALTMAALVSERYRRVFEPGCSIGLLTAELSERADAVVAMDVAEASLRQARDRHLPNVTFRQGALPAAWPDGWFDLAVISEVGYYLDLDDCRRLGRLAFASADEVVAVHWRHDVEDYPIGGDDVHAILAAAAEDAGARRLVAHVEDDLLLDVWSRDGRSVATRTGLIG